MKIYFHIFFIETKYGDLNFNYDLIHCTNKFSKNDIEFAVKNWHDLEDKYFLSNLVFPNNDKNKTNNNNIWLNLNSRPFKICPCNYDELTYWSNNSLINICIFDSGNKIIGFCILSLKLNCYFIEILCTNINQGIGSLIIEFIKLNFNSKPIKLIYTYNSEKFYTKNGFIKSNVEKNFMYWNKL